MMKVSVVLTRLLIPIMILSSLFPGCSKKSQSPAPQQQSAQSDQKSEKAPDQLKAIEENIEKIFKELTGPASAKEDEKGTQGQQEKSQNKDQGKSQGKDEQQKGQSAQSDPWEKIIPIINTLHYQWNTYMPMSVKAGAAKPLIDSFSTALNNLTNVLVSKNRNSSLLAASSLYGFLPDFYMLYKTSMSPEVKRIKHFVRDASLNANFGNWTQAEAVITLLKSNWSLYKNVIPKELQDNTSRLDFSIYELEKVIKEKNSFLSDVKGRVALSNVDSLEKALEEQK